MLKTIALTYDKKSDWQAGYDEPADANAEFDKDITIDHIAQALEHGGYTVKRIGNVQKLMQCIDSLDVDLVFNICEGRTGRNRESQVPILLEMHNIPYVGADALTLGLTLDKPIAKKIFIADNIPTPKFKQVRSLDDLNDLSDLNFPLIVKTSHEGSSKGISAASRVENEETLRRQVEMILSTYDQPALIEEFIAGSEFTVAVMGNENPEAMPVVQVSIDGQVDLGDEFYTNERISSDALQYICPANISKGLFDEMQELAVRVYKAVDCKDFGRVDFRVDQFGNPFVLEINPLPSLDIEDVFNIFPQTFGKDYNWVVCRIAEMGYERQVRKDIKKLIEK